ncbi:hypothetical protein CRG98_026953 [Punica granatum]|uniref:Uncharacterized protein n=1 Tax=Punica granatum TaxID=22663 RepID=A0A2I0J9B9_PUNGR|nr:hypothetical protein CRG98_026953 [Punica granatum]
MGPQVRHIEPGFDPKNHEPKPQPVNVRSVSNNTGVQLPDEPGEVIVFEILGEQISGEHGRIPHHKAGSVLVTGDDVVYFGVLDELIGLRQERR